MDTRKKFWLVLIGTIVALAVIACSCGSLASSATPTPVSQIQPPSGTTMAGKWLDPDTSGTITTIQAQGDGFAVVSVINPNRGGNELTKSSWANGVLTWTYCIPNGNCLTSVTVSLNGDSLDTTWTDDQSRNGTTIFQRQP